MSVISANTALNILRKELQEIDSRILEGEVTYNPLQRRGRGSFGDVYLGQHYGTSVCVKMLCLQGTVLELERWQKFLRVLKREVKIWCGLSHPNLVRFIGWMSEEWNDEIRVSLISNWCSRGNVKDYLGEVPGADRCLLICDISRGLTDLHSREIIHGDIKPANIVITHLAGARDIAQLCDFGLSSVLGDVSTYAYSSSISASPRYASPELLNCSVNRRTKESDIWAFGCASAEVLTDCRPYNWVTNEWQILFIANSRLPYDWTGDDVIKDCIVTCFERIPDMRPSIDALCGRLEILSHLNFPSESGVPSAGPGPQYTVEPPSLGAASDQSPPTHIPLQARVNLPSNQPHIQHGNPVPGVQSQHQSGHDNGPYPPHQWPANYSRQTPDLPNYQPQTTSGSQPYQAGPGRQNVPVGPRYPEHYQRPQDYGYPNQFPGNQASGEQSLGPPNSSSQPPPTPQYQSQDSDYLEDGTPILFYVQAHYDYEATTEEESDFRAGDVIAVTEIPDDGWWLGVLLDDVRRAPGKTVFPSNYVGIYFP